MNKNKINIQDLVVTKRNFHKSRASEIGETHTNAELWEILCIHAKGKSTMRKMASAFGVTPQGVYFVLYSIMMTLISRGKLVYEDEKQVKEEL